MLKKMWIKAAFSGASTTETAVTQPSDKTKESSKIWGIETNQLWFYGELLIYRKIPFWSPATEINISAQKWKPYYLEKL